MVDASWAALRPSAEVWPGSHLPAAARRGRLGKIPLARRRRGVVEADVLDRELPDLAAGLLKSELLAVDHVGRLRSRVTLQGQAGIDGQRRAASAAATATARAAVVVAAAAGGYAQRKSG